MEYHDLAQSIDQRRWSARTSLFFVLIGLGTSTAAVDAITNSSGAHVDGSQRLALGVGALLGAAVGAMWQWFSPAEVARRLLVPAWFVIALGLLAVLPVGDMTVDWSASFVPLGLVAGVVLVDAYRQRRSGVQR